MGINNTVHMPHPTHGRKSPGNFGENSTLVHWRPTVHFSSAKVATPLSIDFARSSSSLSPFIMLEKGDR